MSAVAEAPVTEPVVPQFEMPRPYLGQLVMFYPNADKVSQKDAYTGCVFRLGRNNLQLTVNGLSYDSVRHISDPRLAQNAHERTNGAWDFTDGDKLLGRLVKQVAALEAEVKTLKELIEK